MPFHYQEMQAIGQRADPGQQPRPPGGVIQLLLAGPGPGQPDVLGDGGVEQVRILSKRYLQPQEFLL